MFGLMLDQRLGRRPNIKHIMFDVPRLRDYKLLIWYLSDLFYKLTT